MLYLRSKVHKRPLLESCLHLYIGLFFFKWCFKSFFSKGKGDFYSRKSSLTYFQLLNNVLWTNNLIVMQMWLELVGQKISFLHPSGALSILLYLILFNNSKTIQWIYIFNQQIVLEDCVTVSKILLNLGLILWYVIDQRNKFFCSSGSLEDYQCHPELFSIYSNHINYENEQIIFSFHIHAPHQWISVKNIYIVFVATNLHIYVFSFRLVAKINPNWLFIKKSDLQC